MKYLFGTLHRCSKPILARVGEFDKESFSWPLYTDLDIMITGYIYPKNKSSCKHSLPFFTLEENSLVPNKGDIVLLNTDGYGTILYESQSDSNTLMITEKCNLKCEMCSQPTTYKNEYDFILSSKIVDLILEEPKNIGISGGEPTLEWDNLINLLMKIRNRFPSTNIQILSNGIIFKEIKYISELAHVCGSSLCIGIPLYSDIYEIHDKIVGRRGAFWDTIESLYNLERYNIYIELRTIIMKKNSKRLPNWANFIIRYLPFVGHVAIMGLEPCGRAKDNFYKISIKTEKIFKELTSCVLILSRFGINSMIFNIPLCNLPVFLWKFSHKSISEWKRKYSDVCSKCILKNSCGGYFESWSTIRDFNVHPLILKTNNHEEDNYD